MEFLNGPKAQPLKLLLGNGAGGLFIVQSVVTVCFFFSLFWLKANFLGREPQTLACGSMFHVLWCVQICCCYWGEHSERFCQEVVLCYQSDMWLMLTHFIGRGGEYSIDHRLPKSIFLCVYFCFVFFFKFFFPSLSLMTFSLAEHFYLRIRYKL